MKISELVCYCITSEIFPVQCVPVIHYSLPVMLSAIKRERERYFDFSDEVLPNTDISVWSLLLQNVQ